MVQRVLVVEDDDNISALLEFVLEHEGFEAVVVADGRAALDMLTGPPPDIVVLDLMLPHASGHEIVERIRQSPTWGSVPIVILSAKAGGTDAVRALNAGADDFVQKPFGPDELVARIRRHLRARG